MNTTSSIPSPGPAAVTAVPPTRRVWRIGEVLGGRFRVEALLAKGGMCDVYRCYDMQLHSLAAVKLLKHDDEGLERRFAEEGRLLGNLRHAHLVQARAADRDERGWSYIALEYLAGESLRSHVQRGPLPWREVVEIGIQVASVLEVLHQAGVVHRDIKPDNLMIDRRASPPFVKLIDLNIAKVESWEKVQGRPTQHPRHETGMTGALGTRHYMAPEHKDIAPDARFDVFGLGVTLYELCTGQVPNPRDYQPMRAVRPDCGAPNDLEAFLAAAIEVVPEARLPSARELRRRLEAVRRAHAEDRDEALFEGRFELVESLGVGATSEVFRAYHRDGGCYVALKLLSRDAQQSELTRARFRQEARALGAMDIPGLPRLLDCRTSGAQPYIAMALAPGRPALQFCQVDARLHPAEVVSVGVQLARTLGALHERDILHRDLNASNVLIDFPPGPLKRRRPRATLIDLGMAELGERFYTAARQRYRTKPEERRVIGGAGLERLAWTAPEGRAGKGWTAKSDVFSLGFLLYRLLTGRVPHDANGELVLPQQRASEVPSALGYTVLAALHHDPEQRLSLAQLLEQLEAAEAELTAELEGESALPPGPPATLPAPVLVPWAGPRRRTSRAGVGIGVFLLGLGLGGLAVGALGERRGAPSLREPAVARSLPPEDKAASAAPAPTAIEVAAAPDAASTGSRGSARPAATPEQALADATRAQLEFAATPEQALAGAEVSLKSCAAHATAPIAIDLGAPSGATAFSTIEVFSGDPAVEKCLRDVLTAIRFRPAEQDIEILNTVQP